MEASVVNEEQAEQNGAPVEGAEATRTTANLFEFSQYIHAGIGAEECEHATDNKCAEPGHFHGWVCLPNSLQHRDILEKARAAKARRKRALKDAGDANRPPSDAYVSLEADLDDLMEKDREVLLDELAVREVRKGASERQRKLIEDDERFKEYWQDNEEWMRLRELAEEERPQEWGHLDGEMTAFEEALQKSTEEAHKHEMDRLRQLPVDDLRAAVREVRVAEEGSDAHMTAYYTWMAFVCTKHPPTGGLNGHRRYFAELADFRNAAPEVVDTIDNAIRDLETRPARGDVAGN